MNMAKAQHYNNWRSNSKEETKINGERQTRNDENCRQKGLSLAQIRRNFDGSHDTKKKLERIRLPPIQARNKRRQCVRSVSENLKRESGKKFNESSPETTPARQIMPRGFEEFWLQYKSSLAIRSSTIFPDIDALSIEIIRQQNQPRVVLPSLRLNKNK